MKIAGISAYLPSRIVTNDEVLALIAHYSKDNFSGDLSKTLRMIEKLFIKSGIETRCWMEKDADPMALLKARFNEALDQAGLKKEDIGLLIYTGVGRGFIEPANSCFVADYLGLACRNFDVLDACMGWVSAMDVVNDKMAAGTLVNAAIVNMELNLTEGAHIFPKNFCLKSPDELEYLFPSFTIGEAITVTILNNEAPGNFKFKFGSRPDLSDLCTISLPGWEKYCLPTDRTARCGGQYRFASEGGPMHDEGLLEIQKIFNEQGLAPGDFKMVFTHSSSEHQWQKYANLAGLGDKIFHIADKTGNIVSASIPAGIVLAAKSGDLKRGDCCLGWNGSAGMAFSTMCFEY